MFIDNPQVSNLIFFPRKIKEPIEIGPNVKILKFKINEDIILGGFCFIKEKNLPIILLFHGNGEIALDYKYFAQEYFNIDVNLAVMDFRGYGFSTGDPIYSCLISDAFPVFQQFISWMDDNDMHGSLFLKGRSLGSVCASEIGAHNPKKPKGIIFESGFASAYNIMTRLFRIKSNSISRNSLKNISNDTKMKKIQKPTLIIHGTADWIIPHEEAKLIYEAIPQNIEKNLVLIDGAGHNDIFSFKKQYFSPLKDFIDKLK